MPNCQYCEKEFSSRGIHNHEKACKPSGYEVRLLVGNDEIDKAEGESIEDCLDEFEKDFVKSAVKVVVSNGEDEVRRLFRPIQYRKLKAKKLHREVVAKNFKKLLEG